MNLETSLNAVVLTAKSTLIGIALVARSTDRTGGTGKRSGIVGTLTIVANAARTHAIVCAPGHGSLLAVATRSERVEARSTLVGTALVGGGTGVSVFATERTGIMGALIKGRMANSRIAEAPVGASKSKRKSSFALLSCGAALCAKRVGTFEHRSAHLVAPAMISSVSNIITDDRMSELVKRLCIDRTANAISLSSAVPSKQVGSRVSGKRCAIIGLAINVVETRVSVWSLVLGIINALAVGALEHAKGARVANIAIDFPIASIAFDAWRTALAIEAN